MLIPDWVDAPGAVLERKATITVQDVDTAKHEVRGRVVPYEERVELVPGVWEEFAYGAFTRQATAPDSWPRVRLMYAHHQGMVPLGRATSLTETRSGLDAVFGVSQRVISETERGKEAWVGLEEGLLTEFSIGFRSVSKGGTEKVPVGRHGEVLLRRQRAHLAEVSLVPIGVYGESASVAGYRGAGHMTVAEIREIEGIDPPDPWAEERSRIAQWRSTF